MKNTKTKRMLAVAALLAVGLALCAAAVFWPGSAALGYPAVLWPGLALAAAVPVLWAGW